MQRASFNLRHLVYSILKLIFTSCVCVFYVSVYALCACLVPMEAERKVLDFLILSYSSESLCGCWDLNSSPLQEQPMLLTAEPSLQPRIFIYLFILNNAQSRWKPL